MQRRTRPPAAARACRAWEVCPWAEDWGDAWAAREEGRAVQWDRAWADLGEEAKWVCRAREIPVADRRWAAWETAAAECKWAAWEIKAVADRRWVAWEIAAASVWGAWVAAPAWVAAWAR